jgi:hypothetical protein
MVLGKGNTPRVAQGGPLGYDPPNLNGITVLVVDDDADAHSVTTRILRDGNHANGGEASHSGHGGRRGDGDCCESSWVRAGCDFHAVHSRLLVLTSFELHPFRVFIGRPPSRADVDESIERIEPERSSH